MDLRDEATGDCGFKLRELDTVNLSFKRDTWSDTSCYTCSHLLKTKELSPEAHSTLCCQLASHGSIRYSSDTYCIYRKCPAVYIMYNVPSDIFSLLHHFRLIYPDLGSLEASGSPLEFNIKFRGFTTSHCNNISSMVIKSALM